MDFTTDTFREGFDALLAAAAAGAADLGEVLETSARVEDGDADSWLREWTAAGGVAWAEANRRQDARRYLHAATYYAAPLPLIGDTDGSVSETALWRRQRTCWERAVELFGGERIALPYERATLPGFFFRAAGAGRRPLVIVDHGGREATSQAWAREGAAAHARGYHWMTFDGPGRQAALVEQGLVLRPDWEAVMTPVLDALIARDDVDSTRIAAVGVEHAGYGVARALAFEHRFVAAVADPGVLDVSTLWTDALPARAHEALVAGAREHFNREMHLAGLFDPAANALLRGRGRWYGLVGRTPFDLYSRVREFRLDDELERITTPILVREDPDERRWPGQARTLFDRLPTGGHLLGAVDPFDWLDRILTP
ncbi:hypothetical protein C8N24_2881 [Solirubrobacter pauli]|uniref:Alpha/beta hydrolase family protein DUF1100 n=1 Tax=Solirubrobacter pauli TaxID=166793 RepID=A0A660LDD3_9ACTN|nr:hypothetical protein [Solirubrobacter pauli]RKQ93022.1 hypothetical protein C8N24_2881 [Solirubrobacter pauli]